MIDSVLSMPIHLNLSAQQQHAAAIAAGVVALGTVAWLVFRHPPVDPETLERARRERLSLTGRITDGSLVDTTTIDGYFLEGSFFEGASRLQGAAAMPRMLQFRYRIAGVVYEAAQDVSSLSEQVRGLRIDLPVQVRYDHHNPADSIVVAETWSGVQTRQRTIHDGEQ